MAEERVGASSLASGDGGSAVNPYAAPGADFEEHEQPSLSDERTELYVVAMQKFYLLSVFTIGFYTLYWFYAQFRAQKRLGMKVNPALSALFSLFTAHGLFRRIDREATRAGLSSSRRALSQAWPYIALVVLGQLIRIVGEHSPSLTVLSLLVFAVSALPLGQVQKRVNQIADDVGGRSNAKLGPLNLACIALGAIVWLFVFIGFLARPSRI